MSLADCLKKIASLDPADIAAIQASASAKTAAGQAQADAERAAVEEHAQRVMASAEDLRQQLNAPQPIDISVTDRSTQTFNQPLTGLPASSPGPIVAVQDAATKYMADAGLPYQPATSYVKADPERGKRIADAYEHMKDDINAPGVRESYEALAKETLDQWKTVKTLDLKIEMIAAGENPYPKGPTEALTDMHNGHLWVFPTEQGFGDNSQLGDKTNPMLATTGEKLGDHELLVNDVFRIVHDVFGHGKDGVGFGPTGEENAWQSHVRIYSPLAAKAMTSETRGQNSWVNFGPQGEKNRANQKDTTYAPQKLGLLPDWVMTDGLEKPAPDLRVVGEKELGKTFESRQKFFEQPGARGSVVFVDDNYIINIFPGSDLSTILHETGHIFLEEMKSLVASGNASAQTVEDHNTLLQWLGNTGEPLTREQHEKAASGFEAYFLEGKAPSSALKNAFGSFRRWLTRIYTRVVANDAHAGIEKTAGMTVQLTPEVREVFDRMLSLNPEVQSAALDAEFTVLDAELDSALPEELRGDAKVKIDDLLTEARQKMEDRLFEHRAAAIAEQKPGWQKLAEKQSSEAKVYKAVDFLKKAPLDRTQIQSEYGDAAFKTLSTKHGGLVTTETDVLGLDPDIAAEKLGYEDGKALIDALRKAPTQAYAVRQAVKAMADLEWQSYGPADAMAETPEFAEVMEASRAYLAEALGRPGGVDKKAIRQQAEQHVSTLSTKQATNVESFLQDMARLQRQERTAATQGDLALALQKNAQARMNFEMARIARKLKDEVKAIVARAQGLKTLDPKKVEYQYLANANALAARYGLVAPTDVKNRTLLRTLLAARNQSESDSFEPAMDVAAAFPDWILNEQREGKFQDMPIDDLIDVDHMMRFLVARGKALRDSSVLDGKVKVEQAVAEMMEGISQLKDKKIFEEGTIAGKIAGFADSYFAGLNIWQFRVRAMDGFTRGDMQTGPAEKYLFDPLHEKANERAKRFEALQKLIKPAQEHLSKRMREQSKYVDGLEATAAMKAKGRPGWTFENVITAALNMGNSYNAEAMAQGLGYTLDDGTPDTSKLHEITKSLTKKDWESIVAIGDAIHSLKDDLSAVFERRNGFPMAVVEPEPFSVKTSDGETLNLKGWYYPVKFDPILSDRQAQQDDEADRISSAFSAFPLVGTRSGMTKRRTSTGGKPLLLTLGGLDSHFKDTVQYISYAETVVDVFRISQHPAFKAAFVQKFGEPAFKQIRNMLADIGMPDQLVHTKADQALSWLKGMSTAWALGLNVKTALTQPVSVFNYAADEGWTSAAIGLKHTMSMGPSAARDKMFTLSPFMKERWKAADREVSDSIRSTSWMANPKLKKLQDGMFSLIQVSDHTTMLPLWWGSYYKRINAGATEAEAATGADKALLATYPGNPRPLDASAALRSKNGLIRLATSFATQAFHFGNRQRFYAAGFQAGKVSGLSFASHVAVEGIAAPLVLQAFFDVLWGNFPPEDKEDKRKYLLSLGTYQLTGLPLIKELANTVTHPDKGFGGNVSAFKGLDILANSASTIGHLALDLEDEKDPKYEKALLAFCDLTSFYFKVPASRLYERTKRGLDQLDQFPNDDSKLEWLNNVFTILSPDPDKKTTK